VIGSVRVTGTHSPGHLAKNQNEQEEKEPCYLEHEDAANPAKRAQKPANSAGDLRRGPSGLLASVALCTWAPNTGDSDWSGRRRVSGGARQALPGDAAGYAKPNPQYSANGLWFHPVYDGSSEAKCFSAVFDPGSCPSLAAALR